MTIINGIEIDNYKKTSQHSVLQAIRHNEKKDDVLHCIMVISNPCNYARRIYLAKQFIDQMLKESNVVLYIVELIYNTNNNDKYYLTSKHNPKHLRLVSKDVLWHKENMVNVAIQKLLPVDWKACAWIDADIEFENSRWAEETLKLLNGAYDVVQLFSHALDLNAREETMTCFSSFGYNYVHKQPYKINNGVNWHPGYAWAITRGAYDRINGLYELAIIGSGDFIMAHSFVGFFTDKMYTGYSEGYIRSIMEYQTRCSILRLGYCPGIIRHYYHGSKLNRQYASRGSLLINSQFDPYIHVVKTSTGLLNCNELFPIQLKTDIMNYFMARNEDDSFYTKI